MATAQAGWQRAVGSPRDVTLVLEGARNAVTLDCELSIVMPCLNEAQTLAACIDKAHGFLERAGVVGEVVIADNGSTDGSREIAVAHGARVCQVKERGYGAALLGGIAAARGRYVIMGDSDDSYDFSRLDDFVAKLREGYDLVIGNRFLGGIAPGAMPALHRYLGNPVLSGLGRLFFGSDVGDSQCGLRGFSKGAIEALNLRTTGMEFASEMVVKAALRGLRVTEVPTTLSPDGRSRRPHLRTWRDGWRHLRFLLIYSPNWLFLYPGLALFGLGLFVTLALLGGPVTIGRITFDVHSLLVAGSLIVLGTQIVGMAWIAKKYAYLRNFGSPNDGWLTRVIMGTPLEVGVAIGIVLFLLGAIGIALGIWIWGSLSFSDLEYSSMFRLLIPAIVLMIAGAQTIFISFLSSIIEIRTQ
jgi:glycosyltransferase involved in cell wall biosynthesis